MAKNNPTAEFRVEHWADTGLLDEFAWVDQYLPARNFCWVLGPGASLTSGVVTEADLVIRWLGELQRRYAGASQQSLEEWATAGNLDIPGFEFARAGDFYNEVYERRFGEDAESGHAYLQMFMKDAEPSFGYSVLSVILARTRHQVVITTNPDNLVADALAIYTRTSPMVCDRAETFTTFLRAQGRRPVLAKVHRDGLSAPNSPAPTDDQTSAWADALRVLFTKSTPVFIGYDAPDSAITNLLNTLEPGEIHGGIFWCYRNSSGLPSTMVQSAVARQRGKLVPILGFDEFMFALNQRLDYGLLDQEIETRAKERTGAYRLQVQELSKRVPTATGSNPPPAPPVMAIPANVRGADSGARKPTRPNVPAAAPEASGAATVGARVPARPVTAPAPAPKAAAVAEPTPAPAPAPAAPAPAPKAAAAPAAPAPAPAAKQAAAKAPAAPAAPSSPTPEDYLEHIEAETESAGREQLFREALGLYPNHAELLSQFAKFQGEVRQRFAEAEDLYRQSVEVDPNNAATIASYALFMLEVRGDFDTAEKLFRRALDLEPNNASILGNFALFMLEVRGNHDEAERLYRKAIELNPNDGTQIGNFALFLHGVRGDYKEAEKYYRRALELNPNDATHTGNFALFMHEVRKDNDEAERLYSRALQLDPRSPHAGNFAGFLLARGRLKEASEAATKAWDLVGHTPDQTAAEVAFYRALISAMEGRDDIKAIGRLKTILSGDFPRATGSFEEVLNAAREKLSDNRKKFYEALAAAILDDARVRDLDGISTWKSAAAIALEEPWN